MKNHEILFICMNSANIIHENTPVPAIGVGGILFNDSHEVLLIKRNKPPAHGLWSIPGGKLESGESLVEACRREFHEETGLRVEVRHVVAVVDRQLEGFHYVIIDFHVVLINPTHCKPVAQNDVLEAKWIALDELGQYDLVVGLTDIISKAYADYTANVFSGLQDRNLTGTDFF